MTRYGYSKGAYGSRRRLHIRREPSWSNRYDAVESGRGSDHRTAICGAVIAVFGTATDVEPCRKCEQRLAQRVEQARRLLRDYAPGQPVTEVETLVKPGAQVDALETGRRAARAVNEWEERGTA